MASDIPSGAFLASEAAEKLEEKRIPYILWDELALALVQMNCNPPEIEFVIPDERIDDAQELLKEEGFGRLCCTRNCWIFNHPRFKPIPDVHFHLEGTAATDDVLVLNLFRKSTTVWWLPDIPVDRPAPDDPHYMLSTDPRLPEYDETDASGPWTGFHPIRILSPDSFTDAYIWLILRDLAYPMGVRGWWEQMIEWLRENEDEPDRIVRPEFQEFWDEVHEFPRDYDLWGLLRQLRWSMLARDELPDSPEYIRNQAILNAAEGTIPDTDLVEGSGHSEESEQSFDSNDLIE